MWPGHSFPHGSNGRPAPTFRGSKLLSMKPQVLLQCQPPNTNFLLLTSVVMHIASSFGKWAIIPKAYKIPFTNWKRRSKCVLVSTIHFSLQYNWRMSTKEMRRNYPKRQKLGSTNSSNTIRGSQWHAHIKKIKYNTTALKFTNALSGNFYKY